MQVVVFLDTDRSQCVSDRLVFGGTVWGTGQRGGRWMETSYHHLLFCWAWGHTSALQQPDLCSCAAGLDRPWYNILTSTNGGIGFEAVEERCVLYRGIWGIGAVSDIGVLYQYCVGRIGEGEGWYTILVTSQYTCVDESVSVWCSDIMSGVGGYVYQHDFSILRVSVELWLVRLAGLQIYQK